MATAISECTHGFDTVDMIDVYSSIAYGTPTLILYGLLCAKIFSTPKFKQPFYYQFAFLSCVNCILWMCTFFTERVMPAPILCTYFYPRFDTPSLLMKPFIIIYFTSITAQLLCVILISINRMVVVLRPLRTNAFWKAYNSYFLMALMVLAILICLPVWGYNVTVNFVAKEHLALRYDSGWPDVGKFHQRKVVQISMNIVLSAISILTILIIIVSTGVSIMALWKHKVDTKEAELKLFLSSLGFSVSCSILLVYLLLTYLSNELTKKDIRMAGTMIDFKSYVYDVNCLSPAWILLFTNKAMRRALWPFKAAASVTAVATIMHRSGQ